MNTSFQSERLNGIYLENNLSQISSPQKALVAIHGLGGYRGWFYQLADILKDKNITSYLPDLPGFGESGERGHVNSYREWLSTVKISWNKAAQDHQEIYLLGHSLGGVVAAASVGLLLNPRPKGIILSVPSFMPHPASFPLRGFFLPTLAKVLRAKGEKITLPFAQEVNELAQKKDFLSTDYLTSEVEAQLMLEITKMTTKAWLSLGDFRDSDLLMLLPGQDRTCVSGAGRLFFNFSPSHNKKLISYPDFGHDLFILAQAQQINNSIATWIDHSP